MTVKQLARHECIEHETLKVFIANGWVNAPASGLYTPAEAAQAHVNIRECIAYQKGHYAATLGYRLHEQVPNVWGSDIDAAGHRRYQKAMRAEELK